jgi:hypothetical protein
VACVAIIVSTSRIEDAHLVLVVAEIVRAQVAVSTNNTVIAWVLYAYAVYADARISIPVAGLTTGAPDVLAPVVKGEVVSALVAVVARVLPADARKTDTIETT